MTPEQLAAIAAMQITQDLAAGLLEQMGITTGTPQPSDMIPSQLFDALIEALGGTPAD